MPSGWLKMHKKLKFRTDYGAGQFGKFTEISPTFSKNPSDTFKLALEICAGQQTQNQ